MPKTIYFPITETSGDIQIDWGDGTVDTFTQTEIADLVAVSDMPNHEYLDGEATYTIRVTGPVTAFDSFPNGDYYDDILDETISTFSGTSALCPIVSLNHFGSDCVLERLSFASAYETLQSVPSALPPSVIDLNRVFQACNALDQTDIATWDTSNVQRMDLAFASVDTVTSAINGWDVSAVTSMVAMFYSVGSFQADLGNWDVSSVRFMNGMFAELGRQDFSVPFQISASPLAWNTSSVVDVSEMFATCPLEMATLPFDTSSVKNFYGMFAYAHRFNADISGWNTGNAVSMENMFVMYDSGSSPWDPGDSWFGPAFSQDLSGWDVSNVANMDFMFSGLPFLDADLSGWCVQNVPSLPTNFTDSASLVLPVWGTCPGV